MKYIVIAHDDFGKEISMTFEYNDSTYGFLKSWHVVGDWELTFWRWVWKNIPLTREEFLKWNHPLIREIKEVPSDLSFAAFWDTYKHKVGDRKKAESMWNMLPEGDKVAAMAAIPKYLYYLVCRPNMEQTHATTWLNQRRWENDYSKK